MADQIDQIAKQNFGGQDSVAIRSQQVQLLLSQYAQATGQNFPFLVQPHEFDAAITNGQLYQAPTTLNGRSVGFNSILPTLPGYGIGQQLPIGYGSGLGTTSNLGGSTNVSIQLDGKATTQVLSGQIANSSSEVARANVTALRSSAQRLNTQGAILSASTVFA